MGPTLIPASVLKPLTCSYCSMLNVRRTPFSAPMSNIKEDCKWCCYGIFYLAENVCSFYVFLYCKKSTWKGFIEILAATNQDVKQTFPATALQTCLSSAHSGWCIEVEGVTQAQVSVVLSEEVQWTRLTFPLTPVDSNKRHQVFVVPTPKNL